MVIKTDSGGGTWLGSLRASGLFLIFLSKEKLFYFFEENFVLLLSYMSAGPSF